MHMWISDKWQDFELIDCSKGEKLERWGRFYLVRPDPQAIWDTPRSDARWNMRLQARDTRAGSCSGLWQVLSPSRAQSLSYCLPAKLRKRSGDASRP